MNFVAGRKTFKIFVEPVAKQAVEQFAKRYKMTEMSVGSKLFEWFCEQDDLFQRAVMGMLHGLETDAAKEFMRRWSDAAKARSDSPAEPSVAEHRGVIQKGSEIQEFSTTFDPKTKSRQTKRVSGQSPAGKT